MGRYVHHWIDGSMCREGKPQQSLSVLPLVIIMNIITTFSVKKIEYVRGQRSFNFFEQLRDSKSCGRYER